MLNKVDTCLSGWGKEAVCYIHLYFLAAKVINPKWITVKLFEFGELNENECPAGRDAIELI